MEGFGALVGDLRGSKAAPDRRGLQDRLRRALDLTNDRIPALQALQITIGDEFQGMYSTLDAALAASVVVQLALGGGDRVRIGIGTGRLVIFNPATAPLEQDGPAWWAAREALDHAATSRPQLLTVYRRWGHRPPAQQNWDQLTLPGFDRELPTRPTVIADLQAIVNSLLMARDTVVRGLDERDCRIVIHSMSGRDQGWIGEQEGISQSAVSQRLHRSGGHALLQGLQLITEST